MHYVCEVEIAAPIERVVELMTDFDRASEWITGLRSNGTVKGERGRPGSINELRFDGIPGDGVMLEHVMRVEPTEFEVVYRHGPVRNVNVNRFDDLGDGRTRWTADHVFEFPPGMEQGLGPDAVEGFRTNTQHAMEGFRTWCEANA